MGNNVDIQGVFLWVSVGEGREEGKGVVGVGWLGYSERDGGWRDDKILYAQCRMLLLYLLPFHDINLATSFNSVTRLIKISPGMPAERFGFVIH